MDQIKGTDNSIKSYQPQRDKEYREEEKTSHLFDETIAGPPPSARGLQTEAPAKKKEEEGRRQGYDFLDLSRQAKAAYELEKIARIVMKVPELRDERVKETKEKISQNNHWTVGLDKTLAEKIKNGLAREEAPFPELPWKKEEKGLLARLFG
ncbi:hypothetical protein KJ693_02130 [bacterium]|nr:hypothetical protein [bacterium]MBU1614089.1 hypothetical protein [bacterium]